MDADLRAVERHARENPDDLTALTVAEREAARAGRPPIPEVTQARAGFLSALAAALSRRCDALVDLTGLVTPCCGLPISIQAEPERISHRRQRLERTLVGCRLRAQVETGGWRRGCGRALVALERVGREPWPERKSVATALALAVEHRYLPVIRCGSMIPGPMRTGRMSSSDPNLQNAPLTRATRTVCTGEHHGTGQPECPRSLHHHHDGRGDCRVTTGGIELRSFRDPLTGRSILQR